MADTPYSKTDAMPMPSSGHPPPEYYPLPGSHPPPGYYPPPGAYPPPIANPPPATSPTQIIMASQAAAAAPGLHPGMCAVCRNGTIKDSATCCTWISCCCLLPLGIIPGIIAYCYCARKPKCTKCGYTFG